MFTVPKIRMCKNMHCDFQNKCRKGEFIVGKLLRLMSTGSVLPQRTEARLPTGSVLPQRMGWVNMVTLNNQQAYK